MAEEPSGQEKTEAATPRRLREAREKGDVAKSQEVPSVAVLLASLLTLYLLGDYLLKNMFAVMRHYLGSLDTIEIIPANMAMITRESILYSAMMVLPFMAVIVLTGLAANYAQVGVIVTGEKLIPKFSNINPIKGLGNMVSKQMLAQTIKSIGKLIIVGYVSYAEVKKVLPAIPPLMAQEPYQILLFTARTAFWIFLKSAVIIALLAAADYVFQRWQFKEKMKMTKQEVQEEAKMTEGDPKVKGRIRSIQMQMARQRMMAEVPKADVVITNPTHLAVALRYDAKTMAAPMVVAKGAGIIAQRIKEIAVEYNIAVVEDRPLAQALFKTVELNEAVPENLFQAVAEVLAYVYNLRRKRA